MRMAAAGRVKGQRGIAIAIENASQ